MTATAISIFLFFILAAAVWFPIAYNEAIPDYVSDTYRETGPLYSASLAASAVGMCALALVGGHGIPCMAFLACAGLLFVSATGRYWEDVTSKVHKCAAVASAVGCVAWCLSVHWLPTALLALWLATPLARRKPWFWAEWCAMLDFFITYWCARGGLAW